MSEGKAIDKGEAMRVALDELESLKGEIAANMAAAGEVASGRTIASMRVTDDGAGTATLWGRKPFGTLETGRKAGRVPRNFGAIIYQWMMDKGLHSAAAMPYKRGGLHKYSERERADRSMAWAIARTIERKGTSLYRAGGRADIYSNVIPGAVQRIAGRVASITLASVAGQIKLNGNSITV